MLAYRLGIALNYKETLINKIFLRKYFELQFEYCVVCKFSKSI